MDTQEKVENVENHCDGCACPDTKSVNSTAVAGSENEGDSEYESIFPRRISKTGITEEMNKTVQAVQDAHDKNMQEIQRKHDEEIQNLKEQYQKKYDELDNSTPHVN